MLKIVHIIKNNDTGETYADIKDLIALFKDIKEHPENYKQEIVVKMIGQLAGKIPIEKEPIRPF